MAKNSGNNTPAIKGNGALKLLREIFGQETTTADIKKITDQYDVNISYPKELNQDGAKGYTMTMKSKDGTSTMTRTACTWNSNSTKTPDFGIPNLTVLGNRFERMLDLAKIKSDYIQKNRKGNKDMAQQKNNYTGQDLFADCLGILGNVLGACCDFCDAVSDKGENLQKKAEEKSEEIRKQNQVRQENGCKKEDNPQNRSKADLLREAIVKDAAKKKQAQQDAERKAEEAKLREKREILYKLLDNLMSNGTYETEMDGDTPVAVIIRFKADMDRNSVGIVGKTLKDNWGYTKTEYGYDGRKKEHLLKFYF